MTPEIPLHHYLAVGAVLFCLGMIGFLARRNLIVMFLCAEMMLQGVAINLVAFARYRGNLEAQEKARLLRAEGRTLNDIAEMLGVAKSSALLRRR